MSWSRTLKVRQILRAQIEAGETIALLFSDLRGFSAFTASQGDQAAFRLSQLHEGILRVRINAHGIVVKSLGDGVMAAFERPLDAIQAAVEIQRAVRERNRGASEDPIAVGIGISSGTPVMTDIDFIGHAVNVAQRLSGLAKGGQVLVTDEVRQATALPSGLRFLSLGPRSLRGIGLERVSEVTWLPEVARASDARDRMTVILTEEASLLVEVAKDPKQEVRDALGVLQGARSKEDGALSAMLQRTMGAFLGWLLRRTAPPDVTRELPLDQVEWAYRRGTLRVRAQAGSFVLVGVSRADAEQIMREAKRLREESMESE